MMPADSQHAVGMILFIESETDDVELPGERLKAAREARGETIDAAAARCLLSVTVIQGLESNDYSALSGLSFVRGYLQIYARKLGLSEAEVLEPFDAWRGTAPAVSQPLHQFSELDLHRAKRPAWIVPVLSGLVIVSLLGGGLLWVVPRIGPWVETVDLDQILQVLPFQSASTDPVLPSPTPVAPMPAVIESQAPEGSVPDASQASTMVPVSPVPQSVSEREAASSVPAKPDVIVPPAAPVAAPPQTAESQQQGQLAVERPSMAMAPSAPSLGNGFLQLRFTEQSWVEIRNREGDLIMADLMRPGVDFDLEVTEVVEVLIGAVHATEMRFNGERLDLSGRAYQNVARITLGESAP